MPDEPVTTDAPPETPSDAEAPAEEVSETPSDETQEDGPGTTAADEGGESDDDSAAEPEPGDEPAEAQASDDDEDQAWKNFQKKFDHIRNERDRKAAMGKAWWEKTRYASSVRKENEELKARLARAEKPARDEEPPEPAQPPPELARIEARIQALYQKDQGIQTQQNQELQKLAAADREVAVIEDRLKDTNTEEYQKAILEQRLETAKIKREGVLNRWADLNDKREGISLEMEQRLNDRDWTTKFLKDKATREEQDRQSVAQFNEEFPKHVDALITSSADSLGAPKDDKVRRSLWRSVNRAMMVDLWQLGEEGLQSVDVPAMVRAHVKEYLDDRGLASRAKFAKTSKEKLDTMPGRRPGTPPAKPSAKPVPAALLSRGDTTPSMLRARNLLMQRLGGAK